MASTDRFYQLEINGRPAYWGDLGEHITIAGVILEGATRPVVMFSPSSNLHSVADAKILRPSLEEWSAFIQESDDPKVFEHDSTGGIKAINRKVRYQISGAVQQQVWVRDGLKCMFCTRKMGEVQLTIDHFVPLELGGDNIPANYLSACRKCNKKKGNLPPMEFCQQNGLDYFELANYLAKAPKIKC